MTIATNYRRGIVGLFIGLLGCTLTAVTHATVCRVAPSSTGSGNGVDWSNAASLSSALEGAVPSLAGCTELWLKQGTYLPSGSSRSATFLVTRPLAIYGGFAGGESSRDGRTPNSTATVLSGDIGSAGVFSDNAYHVVTMRGDTQALTGAATILDNLTIANGNADGSALSLDDQGGGVLCRYHCSPTFNNVTFRNNAAIRGGALFHSSVTPAHTSRPNIRNSTFHDNFANYGGALMSAADGGGLSASVTVDNTTFTNNSAFQSGGAVYVQGSSGGTASPVFTHVTFADNQAPGLGGGALAVYGSAGTALVSVRNSILTMNTGSTTADANVLVNAGAVTLDTSNVTGGCPAAAICVNPIDLVMALQPLDWNGGATQTMMVGPNSSAINRAANSWCTSTDQRGYMRPQAGSCDLGAVERRSFFLNVTVTGNGSVSASFPGAISMCTSSSGTCGDIHDGDTVPPIAFALTATPAAGHYPQWGGDCVAAGTAATTGITMSAPRSCTVSFYPTAIGFSALVTGVTPPYGVSLELQSPAISGGESIFTQFGGSVNFSSKLSFGTPYSLVVTPTAGLACRILGNPPQSGTAPRHDLAFRVDCSNPPNWPACSLDVNGNGLFDQADARAIAAWLFGMRGAALLAAGQPSNGRDADALHAFIAAQVAAQHYDIDSDGATNALTDGLMLVRLALGLRYAPVLSNALGSDAMRTNWTSLANYLINECGVSLTP